MSSSSRQIEKERVTIYWYLRGRDNDVGLSQNATAKNLSFEGDQKRAEIDSRSFDERRRILGTYVDPDESHSIVSLTTSWKPSGLKRLTGLERTIRFGKYLQSKAELKFEWNEQSLGIFKARSEKIEIENTKRKLLVKKNGILYPNRDDCEKKGRRHRRGNEPIRFRDLDKIEADIHRVNGCIESRNLDIIKKEENMMRFMEMSIKSVTHLLPK
ncbi:hypothetical protein BHYA_0017g00260 [Botrytis hyacinthi]|uniref:Uncharacterized protein n=1 Tax=Botrytis hyacinthi TaxID=278943 RepID=A0A4Z1GXS5_9HELO|nr:hypothetical protein BHYA_0017g00260 [Botrytis hyacinthi]